MLAARMYGINDVRLEEVPMPVPKAGEILIKIEAAAICGTDIRMITNGAKGIDAEHPKTLGHEFAGTVYQLGEGVTGYTVGQRVAMAPNFGCGICDQCVSGNIHLCKDYLAPGINLDGGFAEYCVIPAPAVRGGNLCVLEDNVSFEEGAINEPLSCVCNGFEQARIHPGDTVLVIGGGPIGIMHCALSLMTGAVVYLNNRSPQRLEAAKKIYPALRTIAGNPREEILQATNGRGADVIITACPSPSAQAEALELAAVSGRVIFFGGVPADKEPVSLNTNLIHYKQLIVSGSTRASITQYRKTLRYISNGVLDVKPLITAKFPLTKIHKGIELARNGDGLKNVITMEQ